MVRWTLGSELGQHVSRHIVVPRDVVELQTIKLGFEPPDLPAIGVQLFLGALLVLVDLLYDDFGVAICQHALDAECNSDPETVNESFILSRVVGSLEKKLEDVLELFTFRGDEEDSGASSVTIKGTVEAHDPVLGSGVGRRVLDLGPLGNEVGQRLRLDGGPQCEFNRECAQFYLPFDDSAVSVFVVEDVAEWV